MKIFTKFIIPAVALVSFCLSQQSRAGAQKVIVNNGASNPVPVAVQNSAPTDNPAFQPFEVSQDFQLQNGYAEVQLAVPNGKRLVIEFVTVSVDVDSGDFPRVVVNGHPLTPKFVKVAIDSDADFFQLAESLRLYAGAGTPRASANNNGVRIEVYRKNPSTAPTLGGVSLSGYLVNLPQ